MDSGTTSRGLLRCATCHSSEYLPPIRARSGPGALRAPQHRMVVFGFDRQRIRAVALDLVAQRADHLRMAGIAALADIDVPARELERRVDPHVGRVFDGLVDGEQRRDLDEAADAGDADDGEHEPDRFAFQPVVKPEHAAHSPGCRAGAARARLGLVDGRFAAPAARRGWSSRCCSSRRPRRSGTAGRRSRARCSRDASRPANRRTNRRACRCHCRSATSAPG